VRASLSELEAVLDTSGATEAIELSMPAGGRPRQLPVRSLLLGVLLAASDDRPAHLTRVHEALMALPATDKERLGVTASWRNGPHELTYRQVEHTTASLRAVFSAESSSGGPGPLLSGFVEALVEASIPEALKEGSDLAVDWTDVETFSRPGHGGRASVDPDASFGHRRGDAPGQEHEIFFGYYLQLATMVGEVGAPARPELIRRMLLTSCRVDPPPAFVPVLARLFASGVAPGDVLADCGYSHRQAEHWALPLRATGARLVQDLHPNDRGTKGTFGGATIWNGELYCPATPAGLFELGPLARGATCEERDAHDRAFRELSSYRLSRLGADDEDGYHRVICPAVPGKLRCPVRPASMSLAYDRPEVTSPPEHLPTCCSQQTMTVPPVVASKTSQRHPYPGPDWGRSYGRRSAAERANATLKDPARVSIERGGIRLMGLPAITLMIACAVVVRNLRILDSFEVGDEASAVPVHRRRRVPVASLAVANTHPPP
jgi:hypothetical protein